MTERDETRQMELGSCIEHLTLAGEYLNEAMVETDVWRMPKAIATTIREAEVLVERCIADLEPDA